MWQKCSYFLVYIFSKQLQIIVSYHENFIRKRASSASSEHYAYQSSSTGYSRNPLEALEKEDSSYW